MRRPLRPGAGSQVLLAAPFSAKPQPPRLPRAYVGWILFLPNQNNNRKSRGGTEKALKGPVGVFGPQRQGVLVPEPGSEPKDHPPRPPIPFDPSRLPRPPSTPGPCDPADPDPQPPGPLRNLRPPLTPQPPTSPTRRHTPARGTRRPARPRVRRQRRYLRRDGPSGPPQRRAGSGARTRRAPRQPAAPTATTPPPPTPPPLQPGGGAGPGPAAGEARPSRPRESSGTQACAEQGARELLQEDAGVNKASGTPPSGSAPPHHRDCSAPTPKQRELLRRLGDGPGRERSRENRASPSSPPS
ncbi:proline-rich protein HaeIII subfamily 1-like [Neofelis nebulosa]|uniref:proline-rich protein HaeIII subfamily 1-like n=1 Tax=Neofelis nebulosa TaxID=61452 RepID=UPI00272DC36E|nr:proline-rich protein HaeIII subfamily 1-like [Neofelis nebulosa]